MIEAKQTDHTNDQKLLYIMGIDWDWIFQRPQIIAEHLEEKYDVTVLFPRSIMKFFHKSHARLPRKNKILWTLPFQEKNGLIGYFSALLAKRHFRHMEEYDIVWIGYPLYYRYIPDSYRGKVIYDCMDNHEALYPDPKRVDHLVFQEKRLARQCDVLFATGQKLKEKMEAISGAPHKVSLLRNASPVKEVFSPASLSGSKSGAKHYKLGYFGTIARWFDYDLLTESLKEINNVSYYLIGPVTKACQVEDSHINSRIILEGIVPHKDLFAKAKEYDCLVMPFLTDEIVEWVDPVKLYEYIALGKCIIAPKYDEILRFEPYVYFYSSPEEFIQLLKEFTQTGFSPKFTAQMQEEFLSRNSWDVRFKEMDELLETLQ